MRGSGCSRLAYRLTVDPREAAALERVLSRCATTAMEPIICTATPATEPARGRSDALSRYEDNGNGRINLQGGAPTRHPLSGSRFSVTHSGALNASTTWSFRKKRNRSLGNGGTPGGYGILI